MKPLILVLCLISSYSFAIGSSNELKITPQIMNALESYVHDPDGFLPLSPEVVRIRSLFKDQNISRKFLKKKLNQFDSSSILNKMDQIKDHQSFNNDDKKMAIAFQMNKVSVLEDSDDWFDDDVYAYFFITDGLTTTAKITDTYKNVDEGEAFFLSIKDRKLFPVIGSDAKALTSHLIVDMGIVESDGDDIAEAKKITGIIIDIAIVIISSQNPEVGRELAKLRKEIKALADFFNNLNKDDRLITDSLIFNSGDLEKMLPDGRTVYPFSKKYSGKDRWSEWEYQVDFRVLK